MTSEKTVNAGRRLLTQVIIRGGLANILGALLMMAYFIHVSVHIPSGHAGVRIIYTTVMIIIFGVFGIAINLTRAEPKKMKRFYDSYLNIQHPADFELEIIDYTARMPWEAAKISFHYWLLGGLMFTALFYLDANYQTIFGGGVDSWHTFNIFFGVVCIGGLFSALFTFLFIEWMVADYLPQIFNHGLLKSRTPSRYITLRSKLLLLFIAVGVVPILTVGLMVMSEDVNRLGNTILSVVVFGIVMAVIAAISISRSVSLRQGGFRPCRISIGNNRSLPITHSKGQRSGTK